MYRDHTFPLIIYRFIKKQMMKEFDGYCNGKVYDDREEEEHGTDKSQDMRDLSKVVFDFKS